MTAGNFIELKGVTKYYGYSRVIDSLDLNVRKGEFLTIYGPNGAGKTTLLMILSTLINPDGGEIKIGDHLLTADPNSVRRITGLVSHMDFLYENLTAYENLHFFSSLYGTDNRESRINDLLCRLNLYERKNDLVREFSRGMKKKLSIARSVIHDPEIVLFDEPFSGLDQKSLRAFSDILLWLKSINSTVILTTHNIRYVFDMSDRIAIMDSGCIVHFEDSGDEFEQRVERSYRNICGS